MLSPTIYFIILLMSRGLRIHPRARDERLAATICIVASVASVVAMSPLSGRYSHVEVGVLLVDFMTLVGFIVLALRSDRSGRSGSPAFS